MSQADELLSGLSAGNDIESELHFVINPDRTITVPDSLKKIAVQYDHNIETVTFDCFRYWDGHDLSAMKIFVGYLRADGIVGLSETKVVSTDETSMSFEWTISQHATFVEGPLTIIVCIKEVGEENEVLYRWHSALNSDLFIKQGLETGVAVEEKYVDVIAGLLERMDELEAGGGVDISAQLDGKLDKVTIENNAGNAVYMAHANGTQTTLWIDQNPAAGYATRFTDRATLLTNDPTEEKDCTNKKYVDEHAGGKLYKHIFNIYSGSNDVAVYLYVTITNAIETKLVSEEDYEADKLMEFFAALYNEYGSTQYTDMSGFVESDSTTGTSPIFTLEPKSSTRALIKYLRHGIYDTFDLFVEDGSYAVTCNETVIEV